MKKIRNKELGEKAKSASGLPIAFLVALIVAALAYIAMIRIEENTLSNYSRTGIFVSTQKVSEDTVITEENAEELFAQKEIDTQIVPENAVTDITELYGKALKCDVEPNTTLTASMTYDVNAIYSQFSDPKEIGLSVTDISQAATGIVRTGDYVDIYVYSKNKNVSNITAGEVIDDRSERADAKSSGPMYKNIYVSKAFDAAGVAISNEDDVTTCQRINIVVNASDATKLYNAVQNGEIYISRTVTEKDQ